MIVVAATAAAVEPVRLTEPVHLDGVLDEAAWQGPPIEGFVQMSPVPGVPDRGTRAWLAYDDHDLYVAFRAQVDPDRRQSNALSPRDRNRAEDTVGVLLDTFRDGRRAFLFMVNGNGVQGDGIYVDGESELAFPDLSWDGVFSAAATTTDGEYVVEMAIPFRTLRFPPGEQQTWNVVLVQHVPVPSSDWTWPTVDPNAAGVLVQAAELGPFSVETRPGRFDVLPSVTTIVDLASEPVRPALSPGIAARMALTTGVSAELTVNPDFSQIESDAGQVTANVKFPLFYPERRPFFLENADLFQTPLTLVHTRSIVAPLVGYKLTGRAGQLGVGFLGGYDRDPAPSTIGRDYASGEALDTWDESLVDDAAAVDHVLRLRGDMGGGSSFGTLVTHKELLTDAGPLANQVMGVDGQVTAGRYVVTTQVLGSITDFPDRTTAFAPALSARVFRQGEHVVVDAGHSWISRDFRAENGFLTEVGRTAFDGGGRLLFRPGGAVRFFGPGLGGEVSLTPDRQVALGEVGPSAQLDLGQRWSVYGEGGYRRERFVGADFDLWYATGSVSVQPLSNMFVGADWGVGTQPHYAAATPADLYRGTNWQLSPIVNFDTLGRMNVSFQVPIVVFGPEPFGEPEYVTLIPRFAALLSATSRWQVRWIEQYDSYQHLLFSDGLVGYVLNYGTVGFVGLSDGRALDESLPPSRTAFAKVSWLGRF